MSAETRYKMPRAASHCPGIVLVILLVFTAPFPACAAEVPIYGYKIVNTFPHDSAAWTQGLTFADGFLYEGTGRHGGSSIRRVRLETGEVLKTRHIVKSLYGEGITIFNDRLFQLTWHQQTGFVYDKAGFSLLRQFAYDGQGWGITHDGKHLIMSNGSSVLRFLAPEHFKEVRRVKVRENGQPVRRLNELEYVEGRIYANVWKTDTIVMIAPRSGRVVGKIRLTGLLRPEQGESQPGVLNGIAYDAVKKRLFVTGKLWPRLFEIALVPPLR